MPEVRRHQRPDGRVPLTEWLAQLRGASIRAKLEIRFRRLSIGAYGDLKSVGEGVWELREHAGPGYRGYLGRHGEILVILLCGGDKRSQQEDIELAEAYWRDWKRSNP